MEQQAITFDHFQGGRKLWGSDIGTISYIICPCKFIEHFKQKGIEDKYAKYNKDLRFHLLLCQILDFCHILYCFHNLKNTLGNSILYFFCSSEWSSQRPFLFFLFSFFSPLPVPCRLKYQGSFHTAWASGFGHLGKTLREFYISLSEDLKETWK